MGTATARIRGRRNATPSDPHDPDGIDYEFVDSLERVTKRVGRAIAVGIPALFLVGILILPFDLPGIPALTIVFLGALAIVILFERLRSREKRSRGTGRDLSRGARLAILGGLGVVILYVLILAFTQGSQT